MCNEKNGLSNGTIQVLTRFVDDSWSCFLCQKTSVRSIVAFYLDRVVKHRYITYILYYCIYI